jgi:hypothetical protein
VYRPTWTPHDTGIVEQDIGMGDFVAKVSNRFGRTDIELKGLNAHGC